jgi:hypothetical protein
MSKAALQYDADEQEFKGISTGTILSAPNLGFMFPVLDDGGADIYRASYYSKSSADIHDELIEALESITTEQWQALMRLGQRVIDGRVQILAKAVDLETAAIHEMRGGVMALQDFLTELEAFSQDAP